MRQAPRPVAEHSSRFLAPPPTPVYRYAFNSLANLTGTFRLSVTAAEDSKGSHPIDRPVERYEIGALGGLHSRRGRDAEGSLATPTAPAKSGSPVISVGERVFVGGVGGG